MSRELVVLGTAGHVPTRERNLNGYFLRWDEEGLLFDPGEGTQRQMLLAGVRSSSITRILVTHFHGDHCMGLPGVIQRLAVDQVSQTVSLYYPSGGQGFIESILLESIKGGPRMNRYPVTGPGLVADAPPFDLRAGLLDHRTQTFGWRVQEPDGIRMLSDKLAALGIEGPAVGRLQREGSIEVAGRTVGLAEVSESRPGQLFAFIMDTRLCEGAFELAANADMLVCESTFLSSEASNAQEWGHLTAAQAGRIARESGARLLVLTHFSQRYPDASVLLEEAAAVFPNAVLARDLETIPVPPRPGGNAEAQ